MRKSQGFTLIELMVVIVIIGILAAIAIPKFMDAQTKAKFGEVPVIMASYDHAQLAYLAETASLATSGGDLVMDAPASKWFTYSYATPGTYQAAVKTGVVVGTFTAGVVGAESVVGVDGSVTHTATNFVKYLPNFK
jgi:prepilin-type N-terminal cleavage/methylation domain-containing protein